MLFTDGAELLTLAELVFLLDCSGCIDWGVIYVHPVIYQLVREGWSDLHNFCDSLNVWPEQIPSFRE